jgi:hypothetical protein
MPASLDEVKKQLTEVADVVNLFKSEAVQLRVLELILAAEGSELGKKSQRRRLPKVKKAGTPESPKRKPAAKKGKLGRPPAGSKPGPGEMLDRLMSKGFFKTRRTVGEVVEHCKKSFAYKYKTNELSPAFARAVRANKLSREKNPETHQYEYFTPKAAP